MTDKPKMRFGETIIENINASDDNPYKRGVNVHCAVQNWSRRAHEHTSTPDIR